MAVCPSQWLAVLDLTQLTVSWWAGEGELVNVSAEFAACLSARGRMLWGWGFLQDAVEHMCTVVQVGLLACLGPGETEAGAGGVCFWQNGAPPTKAAASSEGEEPGHGGKPHQAKNRGILYEAHTIRLAVLLLKVQKAPPGDFSACTGSWFSWMRS